ncbi:MAG: HAD-IA family hydrolase [Clostridia bacterium]|nr:HAD-IA family hydrolase [Clostridia bacterium]
MIRYIVFDCSDTLLRFSALEALAETVGDAAQAADIKARIHGSRTWNMYDRGQVTEAQLREEILPLFGEAERPFAAWYLDNWLACYAPIPGMIDLVQEVRGRGFAMHIISDFPPCIDVLKARFPALFGCFDGMTVSCDCGQIKGDKGLFRQFLKETGVAAEECVFIDDVPRLVENACSLGFHGIVFEDAAKLRAALVRLGVM